MNSIGKEESVSCLEVWDEWLRLKLEFKFTAPCLLWRFPIETISQSENGVEKIYQNSVILSSWKFLIPGGEEWKTNIRNTIQKI
ncbi:DUF1926 domain-containing protein [Candidatus Desantisbacteria bacterium]|nr:DUF1926 domain-containing protein [Candidatus Desantisbacteria bacterium]